MTCLSSSAVSRSRSTAMAVRRASEPVRPSASSSRETASRASIPPVAAVSAAGGGMRQAASSLPPSVLAAVDAAMAGEALNADEEKAARDAGWK